MRQDDLLTMKGSILVEVIGPDGVVKDSEFIDNLIVTTGRNQIADRLLDSPTIAVPTHIELGTGTTAPAAGDTALQTVIGSSRVTFTSKNRSNNVVTIVGDWAAGVATNSAITEAGLFNASSAGTMTSRATFTAKNKTADDALKITWTLTMGT